MTLRLRLLVLLVVVVAAGLVISDVVTYTSLRSFLVTRVDQQLQVATFPVERALFSSLAAKGEAAPGLDPWPDAAHAAGAPGNVANGPPGTAPAADPASQPAIPGRPRGRAGHGGVLVPPGTFGELRRADGKVVEHVFFTYGGTSPAAPVIPGKLPGSGLGPATGPVYFSSPDPAGGVGYRGLAQALPGGAGTIVVAQPLTDLASTLHRLLLIEGVVTAALLAGLAGLAWAIVRRGLRPLEEMAVTAGAIAGGDLSQRVSYVAEGSEVGRLGVAFNAMVGEIEGAFAARSASEDRLRRFLADASHELRTPLTSILGFAELFDLGVRDRPADLATSMHAIRDEALRMGALVDDLFLLAQLDHERPLAQDRVDLADVVEHAVVAARISAPGRRVVANLHGPAGIVGDARRMRQVVDNLLRNAVTHTPPTAAIDVGVAVEGPSPAPPSGDGQGDPEVVLVVHDDGPGIDPTTAPRIFEPFVRSDPSRSRSTGGAGLGLAIVRAVVEAHGGRVRLMAGAGATFEVRIPAAPAALPAGAGLGSVDSKEIPSTS